ERAAERPPPARRKLEPGTSYRRQALFTLRGFAQPPRQFIIGRPRENKNKLRSAPGLRRATGRGSSLRVSARSPADSCAREPFLLWAVGQGGLLAARRCH